MSMTGSSEEPLKQHSKNKIKVKTKHLFIFITLQTIMKKTLLFAATALAMLASCSQSDDLNNAPVVAETNQAVEFGTYVGKTPVTRAGWAGDITNTQLEDGKAGPYTKGFGVFAYYTGTDTYEQKNGTSNTLAPNFMYNEQVYHDGGDWKYDNTKYWPNEIQSGAVDVPGATTAHANGGKVSFFAYAPYVSEETVWVSETSGITGMSANNAAGDPTLTYTFAKTGKNVDLLWGTFGSTSLDVLGTTLNAGVLSSAATVNPRPITDRATEGWQKDILSDVATTPTKYRMNADLVKQEVDGKVDFAFKHALSKVGGGRDAHDAANEAGLMIVLDANAVAAANAANNTVITVEDIKITTKPMKYIDDNGAEQATGKYITGATLNLATGKWGSLQLSDDSGNAIVHELTTSGTGVSGTLNTDIAEPTSAVSTFNHAGGDDTNLEGSIHGVTGTAKNVYGSETSPMLFIPGTKPKFEVEITYYVRSFDSKLNAAAASGEGTWTKVKQVIKKQVEFAKYTELNKRYTLLIHLGITSVNFTATVSDWVDDDAAIDTSNPADGIGDTNKVDLPLNVE